MLIVMQPVVVRGAALDDAAALAELSRQLGYPASAVEVAMRLAPMLASDDHLVVVACAHDEGVVGWAHVFLARRVESAPFAELGGLVVEQSVRGRGVGRRLVAAAEAWAVERGVLKLRVRTRVERTDAAAFYPRLGFDPTKDQRVFDKRLADSR